MKIFSGMNDINGGSGATTDSTSVSRCLHLLLPVQLTWLFRASMSVHQSLTPEVASASVFESSHSSFGSVSPMPVPSNAPELPPPSAFLPVSAYVNIAHEEEYNQAGECSEAVYRYFSLFACVLH